MTSTDRSEQDALDLHPIRLRRHPIRLRRRTAAALVAGALATGTLAAAEPPIVRGELGAELDRVAARAEAAGFHGLVVVARAGEEVLAKGYGIADRTNGTRFSPDTVVQIGSNVKDFTKVAVLQLVEAGKLALSDPLMRFFPDAPPDKRAITLAQLLDFRAGLPLGVGPDATLLTREAFLDRLFALPLESPPGTTERYSNASYSLLAAIVELTTGESFDAYVERAILRPLGLAQTGYLLPRFDAAHLARGYAAGEGQGTMFDLPHLPDGHGWALRGNGGYLATAQDQLAFFRAIATGELLADPAHRARVFDPSQPTVLAGGDGVCLFLFAWFPRDRTEIVIASNHAEYAGERLLRELEPLLGIAPRRQQQAAVEPTGPTDFPATGRGRTVAAWFAAYRSADEAAMRRFYEEHAASGPDAPPIDKRLANYRRLRGDLGEATIVAIRETADGIEVDLRTARGERAELGFLVEAEPPHRLQGIRVELG